ncbi:MAG: DUF1616 domain-containing protein [Anaerolineales bacterium]|nr:DUF1616 domain-containing protein [Anaerolineales bacterium]
MKNNPLIYLGASACLLPLLILVIPWYPWQLIAGLSLIGFLPGYALLKALWPQPGHLTPPEQWLIAVPVSYSLTIIPLLVMAFARLPLTALPVALSLGGMTLLFILIAWRRAVTNQSQHGPNPDRQSDAASSPIRPFAYSLILVLLLAACFRIVNIHYSDYQGDEADILLRAVSLVYGQVDALLTHSKGPGEILLLNAIGGLTGRFDEQTARLPFALAGTVSAGFMVLLGQRLFNRWVGLAAGLLVAIDGVLFLMPARPSIKAWCCY